MYTNMCHVKICHIILPLFSHHKKSHQLPLTEQNSTSSPYILFYRPVVAGLFYKRSCHSVINLLTHSLNPHFPQNYKTLSLQTCVTCPLSCVTCHVSRPNIYVQAKWLSQSVEGLLSIGLPHLVFFKASALWARLLTNFLRLPDRLIFLSRIDQAERFA